MNDELGLEITSQDLVAVISFKATSISNYEGINAAGTSIREFVDKNKPSIVVFDFEQVKFFSSQVLGLLLEIRAKVNELGGDVIISGINPQLHRVWDNFVYEAIREAMKERREVRKGRNGTNGK